MLSYPLLSLPPIQAGRSGVLYPPLLLLPSTTSHLDSMLCRPGTYRPILGVFSRHSPHSTAWHEHEWVGAARQADQHAARCVDLHAPLGSKSCAGSFAFTTRNPRPSGPRLTGPQASKPLIERGRACGGAGIMNKTRPTTGPQANVGHRTALQHTCS